MTDRARRRVLVIGAGFRAANNFLPSFALLGDAFEVTGLHARSTVRSAPLGDRWNVPVYRSLAEIDPKSIDVVAVTVPTPQNRSVLEAILGWNPAVDLVIDTPIAWNYREYRGIAPLLERFGRVAVAEDFMNFPQFELARRAAAEGLLGELRSVVLFNTGYRYHGLSLLRSFDGFSPVTASKRTRLGTYSSVITYRFGSGLRGCVVGPYRQAVTGGIVVEGERGVITQSPEDAQFADVGSRSVYRLSAVTAAGHEAFELTGSSLRLEMPELAKMAAMPFEDRSPLNVYKNVGLTRIFGSLVEPDRLNSAYGFKNALYDSFASRFAAIGRLPFDPFVRLGADFMALPHIAATRSLAAFTARGGPLARAAAGAR